MGIHGYEWKMERGSGIVFLDEDEAPIARVIAMAEESGNIKNHVYVLESGGDWEHIGQESSATTAKKVAVAESLMERVAWCKLQMRTALMALDEGNVAEAKELLAGDPVQRAFDFAAAQARLEEAAKAGERQIEIPGSGKAN